MQYILERVTDGTLSRELERGIWRPLHLERTHLHQCQPLSDHVPSGYMDLYGNGEAHRIDTLGDLSSAAGGMESTLADLMRFSRALFEEESLLSSESVRDMMATTAVDETEWSYDAVGLGLKRWRTPLLRIGG